MTEQEKKILSYAKRTMAAQRNPYGSVEKVFPLAVDSLAADAETRYLGIKNTAAIPTEALSRLSQAGFALHTVDRMSFGGRAVDMGFGIL